MANYLDTAELLFDGYSELPESAVIRTDMETGPAKQAMIRSRQNVQRPVVYRFDNAGFVAFKVWFRDTLARGANWFDWTDPIDGSTKLARMQNGEYRAQMVDTGFDVPGWEVSFNLETWEN